MYQNVNIFLKSSLTIFVSLKCTHQNTMQITTLHYVVVVVVVVFLMVYLLASFPGHPLPLRLRYLGFNFFTQSHTGFNFFTQSHTGFNFFTQSYTGFNFFPLLYSSIIFYNIGGREKRRSALAN